MDLQGDAGATQRSRTGEPLITPPFEAVWPDVERRLRALLYRRGLDAASADDVVQEVALRALVGRVTYDSAKDLLRWAGPVACNLHVDLLRQRAKLLDVGLDPDRPGGHDVAGEVADRMELQRAFRGIAALRPADREAIMDAVTADTAPRTRKEAVRLAVRRHRARSRLMLVMEQLAAWVVGVGWLRRGRRAATVAVLVPVAALPLFVGVLTPGDNHGDGAHAVVMPATKPVPVRPAVRERATARVERRMVPPPPARPKAAAPPERGRPARRPVVDVRGPNGITVKAGGDERREDDRIVCLRAPILPDVCV